ncbi:MAG TPA: FtsQ-type POTRA domain-containing protein [Ktedonobacteraceae bacterium]|nr:FtsQ-type POTRA domain-containing protein [Ktedonobacteraceae bacterium]
MTQKKPLQEQVASHAYKRPVVREAPRTLQRVVTIPEASPLDSWNEFDLRRKEMGQRRTRPRKYVGPVPRTFVQTGSYAPSGQMRTPHKSLPAYGTRVPRRSGRLGFRRGLIWKLLGVLTGGVLLMLAANFAFAGNAFRIEQVTVVGTHNDALIRSIQKMGMQGQNIFLLNVPMLNERIAALPQVSAVTLSKQLPNQLVVTVSERTPFLLWSTPQGVFSVDNKGVVIAAVGASSAAAMNMVVDVSQQNTQKPPKGITTVQPGEQLNQADIAFASKLFKQLPPVLGNNAFTLRYDGTIYANTTDESGSAAHRGTFIVKSADGWLAYLGGADDINPLANRLLELQQLLLLAQKQQLKIATIDLRYGLHPVYTLK